MSGRSPVLKLRDRVLRPDSARPAVMGILNASPESFSDGGVYRGPDALAERGQRLVELGAHIVDVGGESGVTNQPLISPVEEIERVVPVIEALAADGVLVSVDTWKPEVARASLAAGAALVNDVSGLRDPELADACAEAGAGLVLAHTRAAPKVKAFPHYDDVVADAIAFLRERMELARERGVAGDAIVVDPGPDLAKTPAQTVELLRSLPLFTELGRPVLLAASRKDFVGAMTGRTPRERLGGTLAAVAAGLDAGASILRVHDVAETVDFLKVRAVLRGDERLPDDAVLEESLRREEPAA